MTAQIVRRLYLYSAALIGLFMLSTGAGELITALLERMLGGAPMGDPTSEAFRISGNLALVAVGLPLWAGHWALAQRDARQPEGRASDLRRLYAYIVLLVAALGGMGALQDALAWALGAYSSASAVVVLIRALVSVAICALVWAAHWRVFAADRDLVERGGATATLRRWYLALALGVSLGMAAIGAGILIHALLQGFVFGASGDARALAMPTASLIAGLAVWLPHEWWSRRLVSAPGPLQADELGATLRQVFAALAVVASLVAALTGLTALLAAGLRAATGIEAARAAFSGETRAVAAVAVSLPIMLVYRAQLALTAQLSGDEARVGTARRVISYLIGAVSLAALYTGLSGTLATLLRLALAGPWASGAWQTPLSWYAAMALVAVPVYALTTWRSEERARANPEEERALGRRVYLYAGLLFGVVATVIAATQLVSELVVVMMGQGGVGASAEVGGLVGYTLVGGLVAALYALLLRRARATRGAAGAGRTIAVLADAPLSEALAAALAHELPAARVVACAPGAPERGAAIAGADLLMLSLAALGDPALAAFQGPRLLLITPLEGVTIVGARREGPALAREAARRARALCGAEQPPPARPARPARPAPRAPRAA